MSQGRPGLPDRAGDMDALFRNHLQFMRRHRGDFVETGQSVTIVAEAPGFTSWVPLSPAAIRPADFDAVRLIPQSGTEWTARLAEDGFAPAETLAYQEKLLERALNPRLPAPSADIRRAVCADDAMAFAAIQSAAFLEGEDAAARWWRLFFPFVALRNYPDPDQDMLLASVGDEVRAVLLLLHSHGVSGVYAVATHPDYRNRGLSTALLLKGAELARLRGSRSLILQAAKGSFADGFYRRLGFEERYASTVWRRDAAEGAG